MITRESNFNFSEFCLTLEKSAKEHASPQKEKILRFLNEFKGFYSSSIW